jgi:hypothetical protein
MQQLTFYRPMKTNVKNNSTDQWKNTNTDPYKKTKQSKFYIQKEI